MTPRNSKQIGVRDLLMSDDIFHRMVQCIRQWKIVRPELVTWVRGIGLEQSKGLAGSQGVPGETRIRKDSHEGGFRDGARNPTALRVCSEPLQR